MCFHMAVSYLAYGCATQQYLEKELTQVHFFTFLILSMQLWLEILLLYRWPERPQYDIIIFQAFFPTSSSLKSLSPGRWEDAFHMLAT